MANNNDNNNTPEIDIVGSIDDILRARGYGGRSTIYQESAYGLDMIGRGAYIPTPRNNPGMVFFTRPRLNLTYDNLSRVNELLMFRDCDPASPMGIVRAYLDPDNQWINPNHLVKTKDGRYVNKQQQGFRSPGVNPNFPFIAILSNDLLSCSGWPDVRLDHYASDKGIRGEQWIMADGVAEINDAFSLDCTFRNKKGDALYLLFQLWTQYIYRVRVGDIDPYPDMIAQRMMDYFTRIYSFTLDENKKYITFCAACGAAFPTNNSTGAPHDYDANEHIKSKIDQLSVSFQAVGANYNQLLTMYEFNKLMAMFNPDLELDANKAGSKTITSDGQHNIPKANAGVFDGPDCKYIKLYDDEKPLANYHAWPLINLVTKELEWWINRYDYIKYILNRPDYSVKVGGTSRVDKNHENKNTFRPGVCVNPNLTKDQKEETSRRGISEIGQAASNLASSLRHHKFGGGKTNKGGAGGKW